MKHTYSIKMYILKGPKLQRWLLARKLIRVQKVHQDPFFLLRSNAINTLVRLNFTRYGSNLHFSLDRRIYSTHRISKIIDDFQAKTEILADLASFQKLHLQSQLSVLPELFTISFIPYGHQNFLSHLSERNSTSDRLRQKFHTILVFMKYLQSILKRYKNHHSLFFYPHRTSQCSRRGI